MGSVPPPTKLKKQCVNIISQNTRGLSEDKEEELINSWKERNVFAGCLQETWQTGGLTQWEKSATAAFEALKSLFTNRHLDLKLKGRIYVALCLSILLYGSEVWSLREDLLSRLRSFHHHHGVPDQHRLHHPPPNFDKQPPRLS